MRDILRQTYETTKRAASLDADAAFNLSSAIDAMVRERHALGGAMELGALRTIMAAVDMLGELMEGGPGRGFGTDLPVVYAIDADDEDAAAAVLGDRLSSSWTLPMALAPKGNRFFCSESGDASTMPGVDALPSTYPPAGCSDAGAESMVAWRSEFSHPSHTRIASSGTGSRPGCSACR